MAAIAAITAITAMMHEQSYIDNTLSISICQILDKLDKANELWIGTIDLLGTLDTLAMRNHTNFICAIVVLKYYPKNLLW